MKKLLRNQAGFTLVELMIVIVIVGILAAVAVPIYQSNITKAKMSECDAALGTIRTALRVSYAEHGNYPINTTNIVVTSATGLDISDTDLEGKYFKSENYALVSDSLAYTITCTNADILESPRTLDEGGNFGGGVE